MVTKSKTRTVEARIRIQAPPERVWDALTEPRELTRWFPLEARVTPREGGEYFLGWGPEMAGASRILEWKPPQLLRTTWFEQGREDAPLVVDYNLEGEGGSTLLRIVHSGFGVSADWDEEYDGVRTGWAFELRSLRHYLENHAGRQRRLVWARIPTDMSEAEASQRLWSPRGLLAEGSQPPTDEGASYSFTMATGDRLTGRVFYREGGIRFAGNVDNHGNSLFRVMVEKCGPRREAALWLSTWTLPEEQVAELQARWTGLLEELFGENAD